MAALEESLGRNGLRVLEICDFGTSGLGGPVSADSPLVDGEAPDFVNFIRNVGAARDTPHGGGTYGYGKTSLYAMSRCSTIVVDSVTRHMERPSRRFIACHLGDAFDSSGGIGESKRFTGRHWWGVTDGVDGVDPLEGSEAGCLAESLGMVRRSEEELGTSVMIVDPALTSEDPQQSINELIETLLWNFWPRMTRSTPLDRRLTVRLELEGEEIQVPDPEEYPPLDLFSEALDDLRSGSGDTTEVQCLRPRTHLGRIAIRKGVCGVRDPSCIRESSVVPDQCSHIALVRPVELVVKYVEGEPFADSRFEWAGVFRCSDESDVEEAFASAEPPAHDDWIPDNLPKGHPKTWVRVALRKIHELAKDFAMPVGERATHGEVGPPLARAAAKLGRILDRASGAGPGRSPGGRGGGSTGKTGGPRLSKPVFERLESGGNGETLAFFRVNLSNAVDGRQKILVAEPHLVADGGTTTTSGLSPDYQPVVRGMRMPGHDVAADGGVLRVTDVDGEVEIAVSIPPEAAVGLRVWIDSDRAA
ncbi:hypothetical protein [Luteolibacter marinus]|uniref:hypothetical protein n=1 Tax=Luteolibacter marinus TaxID=2776705 RepID=UPI00186820C5|nr:hypothetical protein [Luteolibacter marinus]